MTYTPFKTPTISISNSNGFKKPYPDIKSSQVIGAMKMSKLGGPGKKSPRHVSKRSAKAYRMNKLLGKNSTSSKPLPKRSLTTKKGIPPPKLVRSSRQTMKARNLKTTGNSSMKPPVLRRTQKRRPTVINE